MKQTAVEWLGNEITNRIAKRNPHDTIIIQTQGEILIELIEQAKEMEKEQIIDFAYVIADDLACGVFEDKKDMEKRYEEFLTFRSEEDESKNS